MSKEKIFIFDTTLRDGAQTEGVDFSLEDKNKIVGCMGYLPSKKNEIEIQNYTLTKNLEEKDWQNFWFKKLKILP